MMSGCANLLPSAAGNRDDAAVLSWRKAGLRYFSYRRFLTEKYGAGRVQKVSLDAGFTCPNVDGSVAMGGCTFCDNRSFSPSRRGKLSPAAIRRKAESILAQLNDGIR